MPKRRSARLLEKEEQFMKKPAKLFSSTHEAFKPLMQHFSIFDPAIGDVLPKIINNMDPCSFVRFARTCKEINTIFFNSKEVQIPCWDEIIEGAEVSMDSFDPSSWTLRVNDCEYTTDSEFMKKLSKMPFTYSLNNLCIYPRVNGRLLNEIRNYLALFPRVFVRRIIVRDDDDYDHHASADDWNGFIEFVKEFRVTSFYSYVEVPLEILSYLVQNMKYVTHDGHIPDDVILSATSELYLLNATISLNTFKELVKRYKSGLIGTSIIGLGWADDGEDPFVKACSEVMEIVHVDDINESVMKPSRAKKVKSNHNSPSLWGTTGSSNQSSMKSKTAFIRTSAKLAVKNPSVLNADVRDFLPMIINNLDTRSFVKLARTCKYMNEICFKSSDIKIPCERIRTLAMPENQEHFYLYIKIRKGVSHRYTDRSRFLKKLFKMPFIYIVNYFFVFSSINDSILMKIRNCFSRFPSVIIRNILGFQAVDNWDALIEFIQDFRVESLGRLPADVPLDVMSYITRNMKYVTHDGHILDDVILSATSEHLNLPNAAISLSTFKELVKRYQSGYIGGSTIGLEWPDDDQEVEYPFVKACSEVMEVVHVDDINESVMKPSVIYVGNNSHYLGRKFSLLKSDGSIGIFYIRWKEVVFR